MQKLLSWVPQSMTLANRDYKWRMAQKYKAENGLGPDVMMGVCPVEFVAIGSHSRHVPSETPLAPSLSTGGCFSSRLFPYSFSIPIFSACPEEITKQILLFSFTHSTTAPPLCPCPFLAPRSLHRQGRPEGAEQKVPPLVQRERCVRPKERDVQRLRLQVGQSRHRLAPAQPHPARPRAQGLRCRRLPLGLHPAPRQARG